MQPTCVVFFVITCKKIHQLEGIQIFATALAVDEKSIDSGHRVNLFTKCQKKNPAEISKGSK